MKNYARKVKEDTEPTLAEAITTIKQVEEQTKCNNTCKNNIQNDLMLLMQKYFENTIFIEKQKQRLNLL